MFGAAETAAPLGWQRGYGRDAIPSYICVHPCHLWEVLSAIGFRVFGVFCRRSTLIKLVVKNFAPTP